MMRPPFHLHSAGQERAAWATFWASLGIPHPLREPPLSGLCLSLRERGSGLPAESSRLCALLGKCMPLDFRLQFLVLKSVGPPPCKTTNFRVKTNGRCFRPRWQLAGNVCV